MRGADMAAWTCNIDFYGANDGCDCGCGLYDPDCDAYALDSLLGFYPNGPTCDDTSDACHPSTATCVPAVNAGGGAQPATKLSVSCPT